MPKERARPGRGRAYSGTQRSKSPNAVELVEEQRQAFVAKFGREPSPDDPIVFDPDQDVVERRAGDRAVQVEYQVRAIRNFRTAYSTLGSQRAICGKNRTSSSPTACRIMNGQTLEKIMSSVISGGATLFR